MTLGLTDTAIITVASINNFTGVVNLSSTVTPVTLLARINFNNISAIPGNPLSTVLSIATTNGTSPGLYTIVIAGTSGTITHTSTVLVTVTSTTTSAFSVDGTDSAGCPNTTFTCSTSLTTSHGNDIIIVFTTEELNLNLPSFCAFSISDSMGLTWTARSAIQLDQSGRGQLQEYYAKSVNVLTSDTITESISNCGDSYNGLMVVAITGANFNNPFDPNPSLPDSVNGNSANTSVPVTTSNPNDIILGAVVHGNPCCTLSAGPGYTLLSPLGLHGLEYQKVNGPVSNFPVTFQDSVADGWMSIGDAIQAVSTSPDFTMSVAVKTNELMIAGLTYFTSTNGVGSITDSLGLTWHHILNSGITGGNKGIDTYYAVAPLAGIETITITPVSPTYKTGFVSLWGNFSFGGVDTAHAVSTCDPGSATSVSTTVQLTGQGTIAVFSANDGILNSTSGAGIPHFDFYSTGPDGVSVNIDDVSESASGSFTTTWTWAGSSFDCTVAVPILTSTRFPASFESASARRGTGLNGAPVTVGAESGSFLIGSGNLGIFDIGAASLNGFSGTITLGATIFPSTSTSPTVAFNPPLFLPPNSVATSDFSIITNNSTATGSYLITVSGTSGALVRTAVLQLVVPGAPTADFTMLVTNSSLTIPEGDSATETVHFSSVNGFAGTIVLSTLDFGSGSNATVSPAQVILSRNSNATATLTINAGFPFFTPTSFTVSVTGISGTITHSLTVVVFIPPPPPDFTISIPVSLTTIAGENNTVGINLSPIQGFTGMVSLTTTVSPLRINSPVATVSPSTLQLFPSNIVIFPTALLAISTTPLTPPGNYTVTVTATSGTIVHSAALSLIVLPPPVISLTPTSGPAGTKVTVRGTGFPAPQGPFLFPVTVDLSFDDQFMGFVTSNNGSFTFTLDVPIAQAGQHLIKARTSLPILVASAAFQVVPTPVNLSVNVQTGSIYFPGDTATFFILVTQNGSPATLSPLQVTLQINKPDGTIQSISVINIGTGTFTAKYPVPRTGSLGTYGVVVKAASPGAGNATALTSFEVKPTWLTSNAPTLAAGTTVAGLVGLVGLAWQQGLFKRKRNNPSLNWNRQ